MAKHLSHIIRPLTGYLADRFKLHTSASDNKGDRLQPALEVARLRGEALLRERFFAFLETRNIEDPVSQLFFWDQLQANPEILVQFSTASGLADAFKRQAPENWIRQVEPKQFHFTAYCCLLWDLVQHREKQLLFLVTAQLFAHFASSLFPAQSIQNDPNLLKREIVKMLAHSWHIRPEIGESFTTESDLVKFRLIAKVKGYHPTTLIEIEGKRLKPTRLNACQCLLEQLRDENRQISAPLPRTPKSNQAPIPF